eukprot:CAMPEP_0114444322 /NCGR_PEP_ID=MMETSP0103-20121206/18026_1 /TAXON_ID=37642 ORGANISM="Paraphysomonas imperforata, Strain PA2" /NCGR_SAMPLE_ID=MMETSP0103 /ASSEMBLY_ACC=CAM_ASM_000201 /LENGTH=201 /DNA_ID=CAMNT_0001615855 /DNA_START=480 /DNA_END=1085 /DNA_ORIENTATION=-
MEPPKSIKWGDHEFHPVVPTFPARGEVSVLDLTGEHPDSIEEQMLTPPYSIGKYDENRNIYKTSLFEGGRSLHVGLDMGGPVGTEVCSFMEGKIHCAGYNPEAGDYGNVVITEHELDGVRLWALFGHLDNASSKQWKAGDVVSKGQCIGRFGDMTENGGWFPHVHFQSETHDMPGAVLVSDRDAALITYPDPQNITGRFYD